MKFNILILLSLIIPRSGEGQHDKTVSLVTDESTYRSQFFHDEFVSAEEDYFLVIADTSIDYSSIRLNVSKLLVKYNIEFDSLGRVYDPQVDSIILPRNSEDEIFAGQYIYRRFPSNTVSIEYLNVYQSKSQSKTFAMVVGIFEDFEQAKSTANTIITDFPKSYILKSRIYIGCMH